MAALDRRLRQETQGELKRLQSELGITFILVTHDQSEAMALADRIAVMSRGKILQCDAPQRLYNAPANREIAEFFGKTNLLPGRVSECLGRLTQLVLHDGTVLRVPTLPTWNVNDLALVVLRPEHIHLSSQPSVGAVCKRATIIAARFLGEVSEFDIDAQGWGRLHVTRFNSTAERMDCQIGDDVFATINQDALTLIPADSTPA